MRTTAFIQILLPFRDAYGQYGLYNLHPLRRYKPSSRWPDERHLTADQKMRITLHNLTPLQRFHLTTFYKNLHPNKN